jgi:hypothetical protein
VTVAPVLMHELQIIVLATRANVLLKQCIKQPQALQETSVQGDYVWQWHAPFLLIPFSHC